VKARELVRTHESCFFKTQPDNVCETAPWPLTRDGKLRTKANRPVLVSGDGQLTENGWHLLDNTGLELDDLESQHETGQSQHAYRFIFTLYLRCHATLLQFMLEESHQLAGRLAFHSKYGFLGLDSALLSHPRTRHKLTKSNVHMCYYIMKLDSLSLGACNLF
jgi:hypothetical protein